MTLSFRHRAAFTLLEVMLAVFVFSLVMLSLTTLLGGGTRTLRKTVRKSETILRARGTFDLLARDLSAVFYENESDYNTTVRRRLEQMENGTDQTDDRPTRTEGEGGEESGMDNRPMYSDEEDNQDEFLLPPEIDLNFVGSDGGTNDQVTFTTYRPVQPDRGAMPWGLTRVHYLLREGTLLRTEDTVFMENIGPDGTLEAKPEPLVDKLCDDVAAFDIGYFYWIEGEWKRVEGWSSDQKQYRFPAPETLAEDLGIEAQDLLELQQSEPPDDLPSFMDVTIGFAEPDRPEAIKYFSQRFRLYRAQETWYVPEYIESADPARTRRSDASTERPRSNLE